MALGTFGPSGYLCWIQTEGISLMAKDLLFVFSLFLWMWLAMVYSSILIYRVHAHYRSRDTYLSRYDHHLKKIIWFPVAMILIWLIPSIYRIMEMFDFEYNWLSLLHGIACAINGFINGLIYAFNKKFRDEVRKSFSHSINGENFLGNI